MKHRIFLMSYMILIHMTTVCDKAHTESAYVYVGK